MHCELSGLNIIAASKNCDKVETVDSNIDFDIV